jgi:dephospho-CoA kinase
MSGKPVIGIIGGIGSGKSLVAAEFARSAGKIIAGDRLGHEALKRPEIRAKLTWRWPDILGTDGEIDRQKLGAIVFADAAERQMLEAIVHPYIEWRMLEEIMAGEYDPEVWIIVLDAAILLEAGWDTLCDRIVYVDAPREQRLQRLQEQRGWSEREVEVREQAQWSLADKRARADATVDNAGSPEETALQVNRLLQEWRF